MLITKTGSSSHELPVRFDSSTQFYLPLPKSETLPTNSENEPICLVVCDKERYRWEQSQDSGGDRRGERSLMGAAAETDTSVALSCSNLSLSSLSFSCIKLTRRNTHLIYTLSLPGGPFGLIVGLG